MVSGRLHPMATWMVGLLVGVIVQQGYGWNLPNTYYQGAGNGYVAGRNAGSLNNQGLAGAGAGLWSAGGVGSAGGGGFPFQGQSGEGASGGIDRTGGGFGANQWTGGDGRGGVVGGAAGGVSTAGNSVGADGTGFQQGVGIGSGVPLATGAEGGVGYSDQGSLGNFGGSNVGPGQFHPNHGNGPVPDTGAFGGSFGASGAGFGAGGHYHGNRPATATYGHPSINSAPAVQPWRYGVPASYGGYGAGRWPWYGVGYVYRVPVAHINPDGSYSFSYYTPHASREEVGHSNGNVEGTYGFTNDGAKHNFSFNAAPDVDLRTSIGEPRAGALNPDEYGPQSVHSRGRLPLVPGADEQTQDTQAPNSWSTRSDADGENVNDQSTLAVVGLPKATTEATDISQPTARNQIVRGSTEPVGANDLDGRFSQPNGAGLPGVQSVTPGGTATTVRPLDGTVEQVVTRPENGIPSFSNEIVPNGGARDGGSAVPIDRSYRFGYQTPDAAREEAADQAGNVRGSFSYNNEAGRNDLQYVAGAGMGFRPTGGSLSVPNGLGGGGSVAGFGPAGSDGRNQFGYRTADSEREGTGRNDLQYVAGTGFRGTGGSLSAPGATGVLGGSGFGDDGTVGSQGVQGVGGAVGGSSGGDGTQGGNFGGSDAGFGSDGRSRGFGQQAGFGGDSGSAAFGNRAGQLDAGAGGSFGGADGRSLASGNQGTQFGAGAGNGFGGASGLGASGNQGTQFGAGAGNGFGGASGLGASGNQGTQFGAGAGNGFGGASGLGAPGNQGTQFGAGTGGSRGSFGTGFGSDGRSLASGNQGTQFGTGAGNAFGGTGGSFGTGFGNQGTQFGTGARGTFGGSDGRSFGFGNQAGQGFSGRGTTAGFSGSQGTTRNPVTRSPSVNAFNGSSGLASSASREDGSDESTAINVDDTEQTTTFGGYGDVQSGAGLFSNGNRRLVQ